MEVVTGGGARSPWPYSYLCINPTDPLPELEFFAQLYLYARDREDTLVRVAAPQPWDQRLGRTFYASGAWEISRSMMLCRAPMELRHCDRRSVGAEMPESARAP